MLGCEALASLFAFRILASRFASYLREATLQSDFAERLRVRSESFEDYFANLATRTTCYCIYMYNQMMVVVGPSDLQP